MIHLGAYVHRKTLVCRELKHVYELTHVSIFCNRF